MAKTSRTRRKTVRLNEDLLNLLERVATGSGLDESEIIRTALEEFFAKGSKQISCFDLAYRLGVVGAAAKKLPSDLSYNKKHFAGFGK